MASKAKALSKKLFVGNKKDEGTKKSTTEDQEVAQQSPSQSKPPQKTRNPTRGCIRRIQRDLRELQIQPIQGIFVVADETVVHLAHALIIGPLDTPYELGFFYFTLDYPDDYPHSPPRCTLVTTGGGKVRFNPNLYQNGKVCLSILGTWEGPSWSPVHTTGSVLLSIQSLMNEMPYHNEPGHEEEDKHQGGAGPRNYNDVIRHETLRVAVIGMVNPESALHQSMPDALRTTVTQMFAGNTEVYRLTCDENVHLDGRAFRDPFKLNVGTFQFGEILKRIERLEAELAEKGG